MRILLLTVSWSFLSTTLAVADAEITYLGNEGFSLQADGRKVLIDALVSTDMPRYVVQSSELRDQLENAKPPYHEVDLILATHIHGDHFDAGAVSGHLLANPKAMFVSTGEAAKQLSDLEVFPQIRERVHAVTVPHARFDQFELDVYSMHHGRGSHRPQNLGFVLSVGGVRFLHMGDTEVVAAELTAMKLPKIDVALVPSWYLDAAPWKGAIETAIRPREIVVMHLAPNWKHENSTPNQRESRARVPRIQKAYPEAILFTAPLQTRRFNAP